jgi:hypothetical protein
MLRRIAAGAVLALTIALPVTGCRAAGGGASPQAAASPSPSPIDPAAALAKAVAKTTGINLKLVLAGDTRDDDVTAVYDARHKAALLTSGDVRFVVTAADMYLFDTPNLNGRAFRLHIAKLHIDSDLSISADVLFALHALGTATNVESTSPTTFAGKFDLAKLAGVSVGTRKFVEFVAKVGDDAIHRLDFKATIDATGHLTHFQVTLPKVDHGKDADYRVDLSNFGRPVSVKVPTGRNVVEAPAEAYGP